MKTVKIGNLLYCFIKDENEFNKILEQETPEYDYDLIERHREDVGRFEGDGFYIIKYLVVNPCCHGFRIKKKELSEINNLVERLQRLISRSNKYRGDNVSNQPV